MLVVKVLSSFKSSDIEKAVNSLDKAGVDLLMKYIYRGFEKPSDNSSALLLQWHEKVKLLEQQSSVQLGTWLTVLLVLVLRLWQWEEWAPSSESWLQEKPSDELRACRHHLWSDGSRYSGVTEAETRLVFPYFYFLDILIYFCTGSECLPSSLFSVTPSLLACRSAGRQSEVLAPLTVCVCQMLHSTQQIWAPFKLLHSCSNGSLQPVSSASSMQPVSFCSGCTGSLPAFAQHMLGLDFWDFSFIM